MIIRWALHAEQALVEALSQTDPAVKEFKYLWRRYRNWVVGSLPVVADLGERPGFAPLVGFHAATFGRLYVNSYYQLVAPEARGQGVGGRMVDLLLQEAARRMTPRLKFKVPRGSAGQQFWEGFGLVPFGEDEHHYLYDVNIMGLTLARDLPRVQPDAIPAMALSRYRRAGVRLTAAGQARAGRPLADLL